MRGYSSRENACADTRNLANCAKKGGGAGRIASFPDLPIFRELGCSDVEFYIWAGLFAQSALPVPIMTRLREAMALAATKTFEIAGRKVASMDAPEFSKFVAEGSARLIAAVKKIGKVE